MKQEDTASILRQRARALAEPIVREETGAGFLYLTFSLAEELWAVPLDGVVQITAGAEIALLPGAELPLVGLTPWRGEMLYVLDVMTALGLRQPRSANSRLVIIGRQKAAFALVVDAVHEIRAIELAALRPGRAGADNAYVLGVGNDSVVVLDVEHLLQLYS